MLIYFDDTAIEIAVDDNSYRSRGIKSDNNLTLYFSLPEHIDIPVGAWTEFEGQRYELLQPENFKKHGVRNFEYTLIMESEQGKLKKYKFRELVFAENTQQWGGSRRLKFSLTAQPQEHIKMLVDNLNKRDSGWSVGQCVEFTERGLSYNHTNCLDALNQIADAFNTEWEVEGKKIHLRKVEYNKNNPLQLSYGRGNGFKPGLGRTNYDDSNAVEVLFVQGGDRNIDASKYGSTELLLPKDQQLVYEERTYQSDADGFSIQRADKPLRTNAEDSLDCSNIYPSRVGTISSVIVVDAANHFYDFIDNSIPQNLDFSQYRIAGEKMTVIFQTGMLAGREFDIEQNDRTVTGYIHSERRFKLVPQEMDGRTMPDDIFAPYPGDKYAVFGMMLPDAYISDNDTQTGASWDMFREAAKYFYENEDPRFSFTGELDGIWAKKNWLNIGGKIRLGGYVLFADNQFQTEGVIIRIINIKDYINNPHSPIIELSNITIGGTVLGQLGKIDENEVVTEDLYQDVLQFTRRRYRDSIETIRMLEVALLNNFTNSISPIAVQTMAMLVGDESLQFRFVDSKTNPHEVEHNITYDSETKILSAPGGIIQHMTLGINSISSGRGVSEYKFWDIAPFDTPPLTDYEKKYYLYAKVSTMGENGEFFMSEDSTGMYSDEGYYNLLVGILNSSFNGERSYVDLYGFTEILPGRITTDKIISSNGKTYFDLAGNEIGGTINFKDGLVSGLVGIGNNGVINAGMSGAGTTANSVRIWAGATEANRNTAPFRVQQDGKVIMANADVAGIVKAISGSIGGFEIASGRIGVASSSSDESGEGLSLQNDFIRFASYYTWASIGIDVAAVSSLAAQITTARFSSETPYSPSNCAIYLSAKNGYNNAAIQIAAGWIEGFSLHSIRINYSMPLTHTHCYVTCYNTSDITLTLPHPETVQIGKVYYVRRMNTANVRLLGKIHKDGEVTETWTGGGLGDTAMLVNDGQYWCYNYMVR